MPGRPKPEPLAGGRNLEVGLERSVVDRGIPQ